MAINPEIPKGTIVFFTNGEYSDYGLSGHFVAIADITKSDFVEAKETVSVQASVAEKGNFKYFDSQEAFINLMIKTGKLVAVTPYELHIGCYGELKFDL